jgi:UDP-N-acetylglucosamine 2-epimerase (non-hydrolysing)
MKEKPDVILVEGDTNTVLAGALAASKIGIKIGHVEAGLRSYDRTMPEEINRVLTDHVSDYLFVPTLGAEKNALKEGIEKDKIFITGNTIVDAVFQNLEIAKKKVDILKKLGLKEKIYMLVTAHRPANVDSKDNLSNLLRGFEEIYNKLNLPLIFPIHPRTEKMMETFGLKAPNGLKIIKAVGFLECLQLEKNAKLILTDSGGVQEEACILETPSVTLRENTERPETIEVGASVLAGNNPKKMVECAEKMILKEAKWKNPFGDGKAAENIIKILENQL